MSILYRFLVRKINQLKIWIFAPKMSILYWLKSWFLARKLSSKIQIIWILAPKMISFYDLNFGAKITLFEIFIFCPINQSWFYEKIVDFSGWKTRENVVVLDFLAVDNFDFTRKIVKKIWIKTRENVGVLSKLNFWTKIWLFE